MSRSTIKISEIKVPPRMRKDFRDIDKLASSISKFGLIQPIVLTEDFTLVAGERRLRAHRVLNREDIEYVFKSDLTEDQRKELEFEENYQRSAMTWQEEALGILDIYRTKKRRNALEGFTDNWHQTIADMFQMSIGTVNYILRVAKRLEQELTLPEDQRRLWKFSSCNEAYRLGLLAEEEDYHNQVLAQRSQGFVNNPKQATELKTQLHEIERIIAVEASPDALAEERKRYESNPLNKIPFDQYWAEKQQLVKQQEQLREQAKNTLFLSNRILRGHCIKDNLMDKLVNEGGLFDAIITDPPYAIDMENLNQQNQNGGLVQVDRVADAHKVDENLELLKSFFPVAFRTLKDRGVLILCADPMVWQFLYDNAIEAGFAVQRWPFIWRKVNQNTMNNCPAYNTTKDYEIAMICRKPSSTLMRKWNTSFQEASNVEAVKLTGHPFAKPFELTKVFLEIATLPGHRVLDPFAGGGSMFLEMIKNDRQAFAIEKEEHWYNALLENTKRHYLKQNPKFIFK